jgi:uncharacterized protein
VEFTWDEGKNQINRRKHRVSFETAILVFDDPLHVSTQDRVGDGEGGRRLARFQELKC